MDFGHQMQDISGSLFAVKTLLDLIDFGHQVQDISGSLFAVKTLLDLMDFGHQMQNISGSLVTIQTLLDLMDFGHQMQDISGSLFDVKTLLDLMDFGHQMQNISGSLVTIQTLLDLMDFGHQMQDISGSLFDVKTLLDLMDFGHQMQNISGSLVTIQTLLDLMDFGHQMQNISGSLVAVKTLLDLMDFDHQTYGSSNRNPPERCPRPLYSRDSTQEHQEIPQEDQVDGSSNRNTPERCPCPLYSRDSTQDHQEIPQEDQVDGSSNRNTPERCPRPLYSRDSTQEHQEIPQEDQVDGSSNRNTPERCRRPLYSMNYRKDGYKISRRYKGTNRIKVHIEVKEEDKDRHVTGDDQCKEEEIPPEIITAGPSTRRTLGNSSHRHSWDSPLEDHKNTQDYPVDDLFNIKVEVKEEAEDMNVMCDDRCKEEEIPPEISTDGPHMRHNWEKQPVISELEDDGMFDSSEENPITPNVHPAFHNADLSSDPSSFPDLSPPATRHPPRRGLFKKRAAQTGKGTPGAAAGSRKRALVSADPSSEEDEDEAGRPKKLGGGLRNIRFSHEENCVLVHTVMGDWSSLYGAQSQKISFAQKKHLWQSVVSAVNAVSHYGRTVHHCKKRLSDIKRYLRTKLAAHKKYPRGAGGATPMDLKLTEYEEELLLVVGEEVMTGLEGAHLSTDRVEDTEYIGSPDQLSPAPSLPEEEETRKEDLSETVYPDDEYREDVLIPGDFAPSADTQQISTNHRQSQNTTEPPRVPPTNHMTPTETYQESILSTLSNVVSKVERLNAQGRKEINRSHRLLSNIHTDLLLLKEELKAHREQQTAQSEKMLNLLEESNALKKIKLQLMREKIDLMRGQVPSTSSTALETPAPSPIKEATLPNVHKLA
ncbi:uncharacterized protein ACMZJ9_014378 [Mantella aurantiaca]